jgi:hypothetical protein
MYQNLDDSCVLHCITHRISQVLHRWEPVTSVAKFIISGCSLGLAARPALPQSEFINSLRYTIAKEPSQILVSSTGTVVSSG